MWIWKDLYQLNKEEKKEWRKRRSTLHKQVSKIIPNNPVLAKRIADDMFASEYSKLTGNWIYIEEESNE